MSSNNTNQGEKAAEEIKSGIKGIHNLGEHLRHHINSFADDLIGGNKTHESTGFSADAKAAGASTRAEVERIGQKVTGNNPNTAAGADPTIDSIAGTNAPTASDGSRVHDAGTL